MIGQCKHGYSDGVAFISCPYCRIEVLEAELAAEVARADGLQDKIDRSGNEKAAPTVPNEPVVSYAVDSYNGAGWVGIWKEHDTAWLVAGKVTVRSGKRDIVVPLVPKADYDTLRAKLAAIKAAPTVADTSGNCVGTSCKAEGLMKQLAAVEARIKELEEYSPPVDNIPIRYGR